MASVLSKTTNTEKTVKVYTEDKYPVTDIVCVQYILILLFDEFAHLVYGKVMLSVSQSVCSAANEEGPLSHRTRHHISRKNHPGMSTLPVWT